jgi:hypothetical protein
MGCLRLERALANAASTRWKRRSPIGDCTLCFVTSWWPHAAVGLAVNLAIRTRLYAVATK